MRHLYLVVFLAGCVGSVPQPLTPQHATTERTVRVLGNPVDMQDAAQAFCGADHFTLHFTSFDHTEAVARCHNP